MQVIGSAVHLGTTSSLETDRKLMEMPLSFTRVTPGFLCLRPGDDAIPVNLHKPQNTDLHPPTHDISKVCLGFLAEVPCRPSGCVYDCCWIEAQRKPTEKADHREIGQPSPESDNKMETNSPERWCFSSEHTKLCGKIKILGTTLSAGFPKTW